MNIALNLNPILKGSLRIPASKSFTQRALAAALLHKGKSVIRGAGSSEDELAVLELIQKLGARLRQQQDNFIVESAGLVNATSVIDCRESGLAARLFLPIVALSNQEIKVDASASLRRRPMAFYQEVFDQWSVSLKTANGHLPFWVKGPIRPAPIAVSGSQSSQFISGLLFALSALSVNEDMTISVDDAVSRPYLDMTIDVLAHWGKRITHQDYRHFIVEQVKAPLPYEVHYKVEGDWSSAAFWIAAAAINGSISIEGLNAQSRQADRKILSVVEQVGAQIAWQNDTLVVSQKALNAFEVDLLDCPDLFPVLSVLATYCQGSSRLASVHRLWHKESNRAEEIMALLQQIGVTARIEQDVLYIEGGARPKPIVYDCPNDHRMAMAAALSNCNTGSTTTIIGAECVRKSYPEFWQQLKLFGQLEQRLS